MKKIFISVLSLAIFSGITQRAVGQDDKIKESKEEEIVIRKNGNKDAKVTVEMKGDDVLINGKPLSEFKDDDVSVIKRKKITRAGKDFFIRPHGGNSIFPGDGDNEEASPFLGVTTDKDDKGVKVTRVSTGSAAEKAGLKEGDVITRVGSKKVNDPEELMDVVKSYKPKDEVTIYYERDGKSKDTKAVLGERKQSITKSFHFDSDEVPLMNEKMFKNFNFRMPGQPFNKFLIDPNKKLGVRIEDTENDGGAKITNVAEGSAAEKAGLKKDDVITEVDGKKINNVDDARSEILETDKTNYTVKARRNGTDMVFEVKIPKKVKSADL